MASSRLKSGLALCLGFGRKLYFAVFCGLYPTTVGGDLGEKVDFQGVGATYKCVILYVCVKI